MIIDSFKWLLFIYKDLISIIQNNYHMFIVWIISQNYTIHNEY